MNAHQLTNAKIHESFVSYLELKGLSEPTYIHSGDDYDFFNCLFGGNWELKYGDYTELFYFSGVDEERFNTQILLKECGVKKSISYTLLLHVLELIFEGYWAYYPVGECFIYNPTWEDLTSTYNTIYRDYFEEEYWLSDETYVKVVEEFPRLSMGWYGCFECLKSCEDYVECDGCGEECCDCEWKCDKRCGRTLCGNCHEDEVCLVKNFVCGCMKKCKH